jgi:periplasmic protein TonB
MAALVLGACSKGEPESKQAKPNAPIEAPAPRAGTPASDGAVDEALKERLARQEAAARMFERNVLQPTAPKSAEPKAPGARAPEPKEAPKEALKAGPPAQAAATPPAATPTPEPPKIEPPKAAPAKAAPPKAAPARTDVASAKPPSAPEATARLVSRVEPDFPPEAYRAGIERGTVKARITVDAAGAVTNVEILDASPRRVFDRSVTRALAQWTFNEGAPGRTVESEIDFRR